MSIYDKFVSVLGQPASEKHLIEYIVYVTTHTPTKEYTENHHIFPRSKFGKNDDIYTMDYDAHIHAHLLLAYAYPINSFVYPLNFMMNEEKRNSQNWSEIRSESAKTAWISFKKTDTYQEWRKKKSKSTKSNMENGQAQAMSDKYWSIDTEEKKKRLSVEVKERWKNDEYKEKVKSNMKAYHSTPEGAEEFSQRMKKMWDNKSSDKREEFVITMTEINRREDKRKDAGRKIKALWETEEFRNKMKNRKGGRKKIPVEVDGVMYESISDATSKTGYSYRKIRKLVD